MNYCPNCGAPLEEGSTFCPICGVQTSEQQAPQASAQVVGDETGAASNPYLNQGTQNYNTQNYGAQNMNYGTPNAAPNPYLNQGTQSYNTQNYGAQSYNTYGDVPQAAAPASSVGENSLAKSCLVLGIVGLCLAWTVSIAGIIVSAIGLSRGSQLMAMLHTNKLSGKAKVGHILAKAGLICGIIVTAVYVIAIIVGVVSGLQAATNAYYYY